MERFRFNPETLTFQKYQPGKKKQYLHGLLFSLLALGLSLGLLLFRDHFLQSPRSGRLKAEQQQITYELALINQEMKAYERALEDVSYKDDYIYRVYFEVEPLSSSLRNAGIGGSRKYGWLENYQHGDLLKKAYSNLDQIERKLVMQNRSYDQIIELARHKEEYMAARPAIQPVSMKDLTRLGSSFGMRMHPILKIRRIHEGIDLTAPRGTAIYATADGNVLQAGYRAGGFGKKVLLDHGYGFQTLYGHCDEVLVEPGQQVKRGEIIARVGSTGLSRSPHLHYEVHVNGRPVDPVNYYASDLSEAEYEQMIHMLSQADPSFSLN